MKKIYITESQWAFHFGKDHDGTPYRSESKFVCYHETGQFGSGTYFSTYKGAYEKNDRVTPYGDNYRPYDSQFIQIKDMGLYRVDMDLYQNLYRVRNEKQGDVLHSMMTYLNGFFHKVSGFGLGDYHKKQADFNNRLHYQKILANATALGLKCPSYLKLTRMAQESASNKDDRRSFSTVFMEYNGFNGVNVSGVDKFDNSRHGSVIYDLSKTSSEPIPINSKFIAPRKIGYNHTDSVAQTNSFSFKDDAYIDSLKGKVHGLGIEKMNPMEKLNVVKNIIANGKCIEPFQIGYYFDDDERIKNYIFHKMLDGTVDKEYVCDSKMMDYIVENNRLEFINYDTEGKSYRSFLEKFLYEYRWSDEGWHNNEKLKEYLDFLLSKLNRPLDEYEEEYINEDYFWGENELSQ